MTDPATAATRVRFERVTGTIGAIVHGVGLDEEPGTETAATLVRALHEHGVLFFDFGEPVGDGDFQAFSRLWGEVDNHWKTARTETPYIDSATSPMAESRINRWHTDGTALEFPPQAAMLTAVDLPDVGGDTMWASMSAAWEGLSSHYQRLLEGLDVQHGTSRLPFLRQNAQAVHPAVIRDPVTGRKLLFVNSNYSERFIGMTENESDALLRMLFTHVNTPEFHVRLRWRPGIVAVWEERATQHRGVADFSGPRKLRRLTFKGERPSR
jgi:taurine dioxygenase